MKTRNILSTLSFALGATAFAPAQTGNAKVAPASVYHYFDS